MKIIFPGLLLFLISYSLSAQTNRFSVDANLPVQPFGDNFLRQNYQGMGDVGIKFNLKNVSEIDLGVSANLALFDMIDAAMSDTKTKVLMFSPRISAEMKISKINPYVGIGYSFLYFHVENKPDDYDDTSNGFNMNVGLKMHVISKLFINLGYDFIKLRAEDLLNSAYNTNIQVVDLGVGLQF